MRTDNTTTARALLVLSTLLLAGCGQSSPGVSGHQAVAQKPTTPPFVQPRTCHELLTVAAVETAVGRPVVASDTLPCEYQSHGDGDNDVQVEVRFNSEDAGPPHPGNSADCPPVGRVSACYAPYSDTKQERVRWSGQSFLVTLLGAQEPTALSRLSAALFQAMNKDVEQAAREPLPTNGAALHADVTTKHALKSLFARLMTCARAKQREIPNEQLNNALSECPSELSEHSRLSVEGGDVGLTALKGISQSGTSFSLTIAEDGATHTSCSPAGRGGCPASGSW